MNKYFTNTTRKLKLIKYSFMITLMISILLGSRNVVNAETKETFNYQGEYGWWSSSGYNANNITNNTVSGDFDGDGKDDIAAMYNYGTDESRIHVFKSTGSSFSYQNQDGWWKSKGYDSERVKGRLVSGDFNGDGKDDIAAFYDYGSSQTKIHVFLSDGSKFNYQGSYGWWSANSYDANMLTGKVVSGDFDGDGKDDIAAMYNYGTDESRIHVFKSTGSNFSYQTQDGWWKSKGYDSERVKGRLVSGDFNGDGKDDIATMYDYGNSKTNVHTFLSDGSKFNYQGPQGWWSADGYDANRVTNRVVSGDYNNDGKDDIASVYDYGNSQTKVHVFLSDSSKLNYQGEQGWWSANSYDSNMLTGRVVSGNFDGSGGADIAMAYDYTNSVTRMHMLLSTAGQAGSNNVVSEALYWVGKIPYYMDSIITTQKLDKNNPPPYMDCADFTSSVYYTVKGINIGVWTGTQIYYGSPVEISGAKNGNYSNLVPGDLIFFAWPPNGNTVSGDHVAIYIGNGQIVHESGENYTTNPWQNGNVKVNSLNDNWGGSIGVLRKNIISIRRVN